MKRLVFDTNKRELWIKKIVSYIEEIEAIKNTDIDIVICFDGLSLQQLRPELVASLACLIELLSRKGFSVRLDQTEIGQYLFDSFYLDFL